MRRLTNKDDDNIYRISVFTTIDELIYKLAIYEDLEGLLGCPLEIIFKAINQGYIYALRSEELVKVNVNMLNFEDGRLRGCSFSQTTSIDNYLQCYTIENYASGYGVSWWLREDKSE